MIEPDYAWDKDTVPIAETGWRVYQCLLEENLGTKANRLSDLRRRYRRAVIYLHNQTIYRKRIR